MKIYCPLSGISYKVNCGNGSGQAPHPIFYVPAHKLVEQSLERALTNQLSNADLHLFGAALLYKLPIEAWDCPLDIKSGATILAAWRKNIEKLAALALRCEENKFPDIAPRYHIGRDNSDLRNLEYYLSNLYNAVFNPYEDHLTTKPDYMLAKDEEHILRILRSAIKNAEDTRSLPVLMADWACSVGKFPDNLVTTNSSGKQVPLSEHWKAIVEKAFRLKDLVQILDDEINLGDISELLEHCEETIEVGTIHSLALFKKLRTVQEVLQEFRSPVIMRNIKIQEQNNNDVAALMEDSAPVPAREYDGPTSLPLRKDYPNNAAYLRAKLRYQMHFGSKGGK